MIHWRLNRRSSTRGTVTGADRRPRNSGCHGAPLPAGRGPRVLISSSPSRLQVTSNSWLPAVPPLPVGGPADSAAAAALRSESARCRWSELHLKESRLADRPTRTVCATLTVTVARCLPRPVALGPTATVARFLPAGLGIFSTIMTTAPPPATVTTSPSTAPLCQWTIPPRPGPVVQPPGPPAPPPVTGPQLQRFGPGPEPYQ